MSEKAADGACFVGYEKFGPPVPGEGAILEVFSVDGDIRVKRKAVGRDEVVEYVFGGGIWNEIPHT